MEVSQEGIISINGVQTTLYSHSGSSAKLKILDGLFAEYVWYPRIEDTPGMSYGIYEDDMTSIGKGKYFAIHQGATVVVYRYQNGGVVQGELRMPEVGLLSVEDAAKKMYGALDNVDMFVEKPANTAIIDGRFKLTAKEGDQLISYGDSIMIKDLIAIRRNGTPKGDTNGLGMLGTLELPKSTSSKYDYYQLDGYVIQCFTGTDINEYIQDLTQVK